VPHARSSSLPAVKSSCSGVWRGVHAREDPGGGHWAGRETEGHGVADVELNDMDVAGTVSMSRRRST
jgi:hypothetical protein